MRLIDADKLKPDTKTFTSAYSEELTAFYSQEAIDYAPTVEAEPVRHGEWLDNRHTDTALCSECGKCVSDETPYCPYCGAKMDVGIK